MNKAVIPAVLVALVSGGYLAYRTLLAPPAATPRADVPAAIEDAASRPAPAATLPEFSLANLAGEQQSILSWPGDALVINFWATWCAPCLREIPLLKSFQDQV